MGETEAISIENASQVDYDLQYTRCKMLWQAVILQAFIDLKSQGSKKMDEVHRAKAVLWINPNKKDFRIVCDRAELDPQYLYERKLKIMERNPMINCNKSTA